MTYYITAIYERIIIYGYNKSSVNIKNEYNKNLNVKNQWF